jgi:hypothetical protein
VAALIHPPVHLTSSPPTYGQNASTSGCCRCGVVVAPCCTHKHACSVPSCPFSPCARAAEPSPPSLPPRAGPCCFYAMRGYKRRSPLHLVHSRVVSTSGKPSSSHRLCFSAAPSVPSRLTPPLSPCAGPRAPQGPEAASSPVQVTPSPSFSSGAIDRVGELPPPRRPPS